MGKLLKAAGVLVLCGVLLGAVNLNRERHRMQDQLVRLHVIANSDSQQDQQVKLQVRDAVTAYLRPMMDELPDTEEAKAWLRSKLPEIQQVANEALEQAGSAYRAVVELTKEAFTTRHYDTFSLPAGIYDSLKIRIGEAEGQNWWCVVFPSLCIPATSEDFSNRAVDAGLSAPMVETLTKPTEVRFFLLDMLGSLECFFCG